MGSAVAWLHVIGGVTPLIGDGIVDFAHVPFQPVVVEGVEVASGNGVGLASISLVSVASPAPKRFSSYRHSYRS